MRRSLTLAVLTLAPLSLAACGGGDSASTVAADCTPIVEGVETANEGSLTMAVAEYPPYVSMQGGQLSGVDGTLLSRVAQELCLEPNAKTQSWTAIAEAVKNGSADLTAGNFYINEERQELFEVSDPVYLDKMALITKDGATTLDSLAGKTVGTVQGYLWVEDLQNVLGTGNVKLYATEDAVVQDVNAGRLDAGVATYGGALHVVNANDMPLEVQEMEPDERVGASVGAARTAVLINKGKTKLEEAVNAVIAEMREDGTLAATLEENGLPASAADVPQS